MNSTLPLAHLIRRNLIFDRLKPNGFGVGMTRYTFTVVKQGGSGAPTAPQGTSYFGPRSDASGIPQGSDPTAATGRPHFGRRAAFVPGKVTSVTCSTPISAHAPPGPVATITVVPSGDCQTASGCATASHSPPAVWIENAWNGSIRSALRNCSAVPGRPRLPASPALRRRFAGRLRAPRLPFGPWHPTPS